MKKTNGPFWVGVDGGGSRCRARAVDDLGQMVGAAEGGAANVYLAFDAAVATIAATIEQALPSGADPATVRVGMGLAGVSTPAVAEAVRQSFPAFGAVSVTNDGVIACIGAHAGQDGGLVIAGTGSIAVLLRGSAAVTIGGRGFHLSDDGSGAQMGRAGWRKALRAHDGLEPWTPFLRSLMADFDDDPLRVITWARQAPSADYAAIAPRIAAAAAAGDPAGLALLSDAGRSIAELIMILIRHGAPRVSLVGGLAGVLQPFLGEEARQHLSPPLGDALQGALILAGAQGSKPE